MFLERRGISRLAQRGISISRPLPAVIASLLVLMSFSVCRGETAAAGQDPKPDLMEMSVEQLMSVEVATVFGASKYEQKVTEAPASVSIVSADEIRRYGYRTLADALRSVRGVYVTNDRNYNYLGVRGFNRPGDYNSRILLLVDGHRINDDIYDTAPIGTEFPVDVDLIDRIEVIRGPSSSLYGSNAFFGVVNVITRQPGDLQGVGVSGAAGGFKTYNGRLSYGKEFANGVGLLLSGSAMQSGGAERLYYKEFDTPQNNQGYAERADGDKNYQFYTKLSYRDFSLTGALASREKTIPTASYGTVFNDPRTRTTDGHSFLDLKYAHSFEDNTEVTARAFYDRYLYDGDYLYDRAEQGGASSLVLTKDQSWGTWWGGETQATRTFFDRHKVTAGLSYRSNRVQQRNYDAAPFIQYLDDRRTSAIWALYLQDEIQLLDGLVLSAGLRYDHYDSFGGATNPRLALIYRPLEGSAIKLLYGQAFRAPNAYETYYSDSGQTAKANPALSPEKIQTYEMVYEQYFLKHYRSSLSGFYYRISDLISQRIDRTDGLIQFDNIDAINARGAELELEGNWESGLKGRLSYTYQKAKDADSGRPLTNSPEHLAKLNLVLPLLRDRLFLGVEEQYQGSRTTLAGNQTGAAYLSNATLSCHTPLTGLELSVSAYNLFDAHYGDPGAAEHVQDVIRQDGRSFRVKLDYSF